LSARKTISRGVPATLAAEHATQRQGPWPAPGAGRPVRLPYSGKSVLGHSPEKVHLISHVHP
jgi:hypothetical protein